MVAKYLTQTERDILFKELSNVQQEYLTNFLKEERKPLLLVYWHNKRRRIRGRLQAHFNKLAFS
ncbi:hypothetical protein LQK80_32550 [Bacillus thuringiensis]|nr:hypothetical protein [Bacillus thuringiensis]